MQKIILLLITALALTAFIVPRQSSNNQQVWTLQGITVPEKTECRNDPYTRYGYIWIKNDDNLSSNRAQLLTELEKEFGKVALTRFYANPKYPKVIALVHKTINCGTYNGPRKNVTSYQFFDGTDSLHVLKQLESRKKSSTDLADFKIVKLWHTEKQLAILNSQSRDVVKGEEVKWR